MSVGRIRRVSRIMSVLCPIGMVAPPVWLIVGWRYPRLLGGLPVIAWIMHEGAKMADDNRQFV